MYAVIKAGGKQQRVKPGDIIEVELMPVEGDTVTFQPLLVVDEKGATHVGKDAAKAVVTAKPVGEKKGDKIRVLKYRPKTGYSRRQGHRQRYTLLEIAEVKLGGASRSTSQRSSSAQKASASQKSAGSEKAGASQKSAGSEKSTSPRKKTTTARTDGKSEGAGSGGSE